MALTQTHGHTRGKTERENSHKQGAIRKTRGRECRRWKCVREAGNEMCL